MSATEAAQHQGKGEIMNPEELAAAVVVLDDKGRQEFIGELYDIMCMHCCHVYAKPLSQGGDDGYGRTCQCWNDD